MGACSRNHLCWCRSQVMIDAGPRNHLYLLGAQVKIRSCPRNQIPTKIHKSLDHIRCSYLCELAPSSRRRPFDLISMHGSEFYTHAPQRAHNPKGGQQKETIQRNNPPTTQPGTSQKPNQNPPQRGLRCSWARGVLNSSDFLLLLELGE